MIQEATTVATGSGSRPAEAVNTASHTKHAKYRFLVAELERHTKRFDADSTRHKDLYRRLRYASIILTALTTAAAAIAATHTTMQPWINLGIVVITATVAVLAAIEGMRKPSELWIHERTTLYALTDLKRELEYRCASDVDEDAVDGCFKRLQALLGASGEKWNNVIVLPRQAPGDAHVPKVAT